VQGGARRVDRPCARLFAEEGNQMAVIQAERLFRQIGHPAHLRNVSTSGEAIRTRNRRNRRIGRRGSPTAAQMASTISPRSTSQSTLLAELCRIWGAAILVSRILIGRYA
jgi:hypothetical protein